MICPRSELLEIVRRTIKQATPEEKQGLREALCGNACEVCGRRRLTLLLDTESALLQCFQCVGSATAAPVFVREPGDWTADDIDFLRAIGVAWR